jgi:hypothetical protein
MSLGNPCFDLSRLPGPATAPPNRQTTKSQAFNITPLALRTILPGDISSIKHAEALILEARYIAQFEGLLEIRMDL